MGPVSSSQTVRFRVPEGVDLRQTGVTCCAARTLRRLGGSAGCDRWPGEEAPTAREFSRKNFMAVNVWLQGGAPVR